MASDIIDSEQCAALLRCTSKRVEELARVGEIPGLKIGRNWLFVRDDLLAYLAEKAREEAQERRIKRQPHAPLPMAKPHRQTPPVLSTAPCGDSRTSEAIPESRAEAKPPPSIASEKDQVIEEYLHSGIKIQIYRQGGASKHPTYFAVVMNPAAKSPTGGLVDAPSYVELRTAAEARAEWRAALWQQRQMRGAK